MPKDQDAPSANENRDEIIKLIGLQYLAQANEAMDELDRLLTKLQQLLKV